MKSKTGAIEEIKKMVFGIFLSGVLFGISSCCTKKDCLGFDDINEVRFLNFQPSEVDSIAVEIFQSNSNFTNRIDSTFSSAHGRDANDTDLILFLNEHISTSHEYKFTLFGTGQVYLLTGLTTRKEECNCPSDKYDILNSYSVNGERYSESFLSITK